jgi:hypothetical protein
MKRRRAKPRTTVMERNRPRELGEEDNCTKPELWVYRDRTTTLLLRYLHMSVEVGRLPSILGREFFRAHVTSYRVNTFEDAVIFVHDVERSLEQLDAFSQQMIARIVLQEYTRAEAARLLGCAQKTVSRRFPEALDKLSKIFLSRGLLREWETSRRQSRRPCQESSGNEHVTSYCKTAV